MNEENTVISSREEHCLQVLPTQVNVRIYAIHTSGPVLAEASANLNGCFTIRGLKVVDVGNGPFISMLRGRKVRFPQREADDILHSCLHSEHFSN